MKFPRWLLWSVLAAGSVVAQTAGAGSRNGGISFVTRRLTTAGAGGQAGNFFAAGGVSTAPAGAGQTAGTVAPVLAGTPPSPQRLTDPKALAALRQLAARGDREAQRLLGEQAASGRPARR